MTYVAGNFGFSTPFNDPYDPRRHLFDPVTGQPPFPAPDVPMPETITERSIGGPGVRSIQGLASAVRGGRSPQAQGLTASAPATMQPTQPRPQPTQNAGPQMRDILGGVRDAAGRVGDAIANPVDTVKGVAGRIGDFIGWDEMPPEYKAGLLAQGLAAGANIYGQRQAGRQADEERAYRREQEREERERKRRAAQALGPMFAEFMKRGG